MKKYLIITFFILVSIMPNLVLAQGTKEAPKLDYSGLVKCDGVVLTKDGKDVEPYRTKVCDFQALMSTVKSTINWLFVITIPILTVILAYGGLLYMTGSQKNIGTAKSIFQSSAKGFIIMLVAWISVITVVNWFIAGADKETIKTFININ